MNWNKKGFTLIELLVVMGVLGVLMSVTILVINPAEHLRRARDTQRISDLNVLNTAINIYIANNHNILDSIFPNDCYYSATNGFLTIDSGGFCASGYPHSSDSRAVDGTGWLPINFSVDNNSPLSALPVDPLNNTVYYETYAFGGTPYVKSFFPGAFAYIGGGGDYLYQYSYSYGFTASWEGTYKLVTKMESQAYTEKMVNDGGTSDEYFETGSDVSLLIEPGPTEPPATTTTTAPLALKEYLLLVVPGMAILAAYRGQMPNVKKLQQMPVCPVPIWLGYRPLKIIFITVFLLAKASLIIIMS